MAMETETITNRRNSTVAAKSEIFKLLSDSYAGGQSYIDGNHLHKFSVRESTVGYDERKKRAVHLNNVQPLADMLASFLMTQPPVRTSLPQDKMLEDASNGSSLDNFMLGIATSSLLHTTGILVDSPSFVEDEVPSEADRLAQGLFPYCVKYEPWEILDYYPETGELEWILLDNSYTDKSDPFQEDKEITSYRLWMKGSYQDFIKIENVGEDIFKAEEPVPTDIDTIPFIFCNWRSKIGSKISDTIFEDIAYFDRAIYNSMSLMDEMLATGTFKFLFYPSKNNKLPKQLESGFTANAVLPYDANSTNKPFFEGAKLEEVEPFLKIMDFYVHSIKRALGLDTDIEKTFVQSGRAKELDFKKVKSLLSSGARNMEDIEKKIFYYTALWESKELDDKFEVKYFDDFLGEELTDRLMRYYEMLMLPYEMLKTTTTQLIAKANLANDVPPEKMKEIIKEIADGPPEPEPVKIDELVDQEKEEQNKNQGETA